MQAFRVIANYFLLVVTLALSQLTRAQSFVPLHEFANGQDGAVPWAGLSMDRAGNLYGTTAGGGGVNGHGLVFKMSHKNGGWLLVPLYTFMGGNDGSTPENGVSIDDVGRIYGTTPIGGPGQCNGGNGCGTAFQLAPPNQICKSAFCFWTEPLLYSFTDGSDGAFPCCGDLVFDSSGNIYGTTEAGGVGDCNGLGCGIIYKLTLSGRGQWTESIIYSFTGGNDGSAAYGGVVFDRVGNLYGTTYSGSTYNCGTVFRLAPSGSGWTESTLHVFNPNAGDGCNPVAGLTIDMVGDLYGTTSNGGVQNGGTVFEVVPQPNGTWTETVLYALSSGLGYAGPSGAVTLDASGNLYGTTYGGGAYGLGAVFKLTPSGSGWSYTSLHDFSGYADGEFPVGNVTLDGSSNIYGTASQGGDYGYGAVWEITP